MRNAILLSIWCMMTEKDTTIMYKATDDLCELPRLTRGETALTDRSHKHRNVIACVCKYRPVSPSHTEF